MDSAFVPVAIGAFGPQQELASNRVAWAGAEIAGDLENNETTSSNYRLCNGPTGPALLTIIGLQSKAVRTRRFKINKLIAQPNSSADAEMSDTMFEIHWQTCNPITIDTFIKTWSESRCNSSISHENLHGGIASASLNNISKLQRAMANPGTEGFNLHTHGVQCLDDTILHLAHLNVSAKGAAAWGLIRVAASERPEKRWTAYDMSPPLVAHHRQYPVVKENDAFGVVAKSGTEAIPKLLAEHNHDSKQAHLRAYMGRTIITGGLGGGQCFCKDSNTFHDCSSTADTDNTCDFLHKFSLACALIFVIFIK
jgi:hypothetical protein